jgi:integrase
VRRVIDAAGRAGRQRDRDKLLLMLMFRHGLRVGEAIDLRWTDFDLDAPRDRPFYVRRLKGSKDGIHTLEPDTALALKRMKATSDGVYVFRSERGGPLSHDVVRVICERAGRLAGFGFRVRPHMLRHAAGFALAEAVHGYPADPRFSRAPGYQEHRHLHRDFAEPAQGRAGAVTAVIYSR